MAAAINSIFISQLSYRDRIETTAVNQQNRSDSSVAAKLALNVKAFLNHNAIASGNVNFALTEEVLLSIQTFSLWESQETSVVYDKNNFLSPFCKQNIFKIAILSSV